MRIFFTRFFLFTTLIAPSLGLFAGLITAPVFGVAAAAAAGFCWREGMLGQVFRTPVAWLFGALLGWAALSLCWAPGTASGLEALCRLAGLFAGGMVFLHAAAEADSAMEKYGVRFILFGLGAGLLAIFEEVLSDGAVIKFFRQSVGGSPVFYLHDFNRGATVLALMVWPAALALARAGKTWHVLALFAVAGGLLFSLISLAAVVAFLAGVIAFGLALLLKDKIFPLAIAATMLAALLIPLVFSRIDPAALEQQFPALPDSAAHRLYIWHFTAEKAAEQPVLGWGLNASRHIPGKDQEWRPGKTYLPLHPHNNVMQLWLELGIPGLAIAAALVAWVLRGIARARLLPVEKAAALAALTAYITIGALAYGIWQEWWISAGFLTAGFLKALTGRQPTHA